MRQYRVSVPDCEAMAGPVDFDVIGKRSGLALGVASR